MRTPDCLKTNSDPLLLALSLSLSVIPQTQFQYIVVFYPSAPHVDVD